MFKIIHENYFAVPQKKTLRNAKNYKKFLWGICKNCSSLIKLHNSYLLLFLDHNYMKSCKEKITERKVKKKICNKIKKKKNRLFIFL